MDDGINIQGKPTPTMWVEPVNAEVEIKIRANGEKESKHITQASTKAEAVELAVKYLQALPAK